MTYVHGFFGNYRIALSETTSNPVVKQKTFNKRKHIHTPKKTNDKEMANKPNVGKRVDTKHC